MGKYYNKRVKYKTLREEKLVFRKVMINIKKVGAEALGPNLERPYRITCILCSGTYQLEDLDGKLLHHSWNVEHLCKYC